MLSINKIFTVIDPNTDDQIALKRSVRMAKIENADIHAYLGLSPTVEVHDPEALKRVELSRYEPWFGNIVEQAKEEGVSITTEMEWSDDWRPAVGIAAKRANSDIIVKSSYPRLAEKKRLIITNSERILLETAPCPIRLVSSHSYDESHKILIAIDASREGEVYENMFKEVVAYGTAIRNTYDDGELHAVHVYEDQDNFRHVTDISKRIGIDTDFVHVVAGTPETAVVEVAQKIDAQVIVVGLSTKSTLMNRFTGYMTDKLLSNIDRDMMIVVPKSEN